MPSGCFHKRHRYQSANDETQPKWRDASGLDQYRAAFALWKEDEAFICPVSVEKG